MTKADKFRKAAKVCWIAGAFFTWSFIYLVTKNLYKEPAVGMVVSAVASCGIQYLMTLIESTIIEGFLPAPWNLDFKNNPTMAVLAIAAYGCFVLDVFLNLGGVYQFTRHLGDAVGDVQQLGISDYIIKVFSFVATFFVAMLFALGSELLEALADQYEGKRQTMQRKQPVAPQEHRREPPPQQQKQQKTSPQQVEDTRLQERLLKLRAEKEQVQNG